MSTSSHTSSHTGVAEPRAFEQVRRWGSLVKISHTIFALPFALSMVVILWDRQSVTFFQLGLILLCVTAARTAAMGYNRIVDRDIDARNPRTADRELPSGKVSLRGAWALVASSCVVFLLGAGLLGNHCLVLAPVVLAILLLYSWCKRVGWVSHFVLGLSLALAPGGVWYALTAEWSLLPVPLMLSVLLWVAGFDIIYACQDVEFDRAERLGSIPAKIGVQNALNLSRALHLGAVLLLLLFGIFLGVGVPYIIGLLAFAALVASQHQLVSPNDLSRVDQAFFVRNGWASMAFFVGVAVDVMLR